MSQSEENQYGLTSNQSGGIIRRMDQRLKLMNRLVEEIQAKQTGLSNTKTLEVPLDSGVVMLMKWCPAGSFLMGSPEDEEDREDDENQVQVTLSHGFWMAQTQVTQAQWQAVMVSNPSHFIGENLPVEKVSWYDAEDFIKKVNGSGVIQNGWKMALPTEAQWEYACRSGEAGSYSGGSIEQVAWYEGNGEDKTHPAGIKKPNAWGLHDMHGNVAEWIANWYDDILLEGSDPLGLSFGFFRVLRGGSWSCYAAYCRAACRLRVMPDNHYNYIGFRPAIVQSN